MIERVYGASPVSAGQVPYSGPTTKTGQESCELPWPYRPHLSERGSAVSIMLPSESDKNNQVCRVAHKGGAA